MKKHAATYTAILRTLAPFAVSACTASAALAQPLEPIQILQPADAAATNLFGFSAMELVDGKLYVSAPNRLNGGTSGTGAVYVYDADTLTLLSTITASNAPPVPEPFRFGRALAIEGDRLLVSSREADPTNPDREGAAYLMQVSTGAQLDRYTPPTFRDLPSPDFGESVALAGDIAVVGDPNAARSNPAIRDGVATFFDIPTGQQEALLGGSVVTYDTGFGVAMASNEGGVYIVGESANGVNLYDPETRQILDTLSPNTGGSFAGSDIAIFGDVLAVSDSNVFPGEFVASAVYLFDLTTNELLRTVQFDPDPGDLGLGRFIALNDQYLLATRFLPGTFSFELSVLVFDAATGDLLTEIQAPVGSESRFGGALALNGNLAYIGSGPNDVFPLPGGAVLVYDLSQLEACAADTNGDGQLTPADFNAWVLAFNAQAPECDQNGDSLCDPSDFNAWVINFNAGC
ncbi:MAG: GC-type dockerin domain-anchored protein [Planctomycetota bacterium]